MEAWILDNEGPIRFFFFLVIFALVALGETLLPRRLWLLPLLLTFAHLSAAASAPTPARVASTNLCTDQLLVMLAEPEQIISLSQLATNPDYSFVAHQARAYPGNRGRAEELLGREPDLILVSSHTPRLTRARLLEQGMRLEALPAASDIGEIRQNLRRMGRWLGRQGRAEAMIATLERRLAEVAEQSPRGRPSALFLQPNGYTSGRGTLQDEALRLAGWRNLATEAGIQGYAPIDLERLITLAPDAIFTSTSASKRNALALRILDHPALRKVAHGDALRQVDYRYWICGGPMLAEAVEQLARARRQLPPEARP